MARSYNDISDLYELIKLNDNPDQKIKSKIYNLAKCIIDHDRRYIKQEITNVKNTMKNLWYITKKQNKALQCSSLIENENDDDCDYDDEHDYYSYCCNGQGD